MNNIKHVSPEKILNDDFERYGWLDDPVYLKNRLSILLDLLDEKYTPELEREKQALYFVNSFYIRFN